MSIKLLRKRGHSYSYQLRPLRDEAFFFAVTRVQGLRTEAALRTNLVETSGGYAPVDKDTGVVKPKGSARIRAHEGLETIPLTARKPSWRSADTACPALECRRWAST